MREGPTHKELEYAFINLMLPLLDYTNRAKVLPSFKRPFVKALEVPLKQNLVKNSGTINSLTINNIDVDQVAVFLIRSISQSFVNWTWSLGRTEMTYQLHYIKCQR